MVVSMKDNTANVSESSSNHVCMHSDLAACHGSLFIGFQKCACQNKAHHVPKQVTYSGLPSVHLVILVGLLGFEPGQMEISPACMQITFQKRLSGL